MSQPSLQTTCAYCGVGCGVSLPRHNDRSIKVSGDKHHPANQGRLCVKGTHLGDVLPLKNRLLHPHIDNQRVSWEQASQTIADKIQSAQSTYGKDAFAFYLSGQLLTEDYYAANKLAKGFLGTANVDTNSRLCMSSAVAAHIRAFGEDAPPSNYEDIELADLIVITGSNMAWAHPVLFQRLQQARKKNPNKKMVVIDPRQSATAKEADLHLAIKPGTDGQLFNALLVYLATHKKLDIEYLQDHVNGVDEAIAAAIDDVGTSTTTQAELCGIAESELIEFCTWFANTQKTTTLWSMGINQSESGVDKGNAIINAHLATGRIGKPGATAFSITGQPNAMGGREVGGLANQLAVHRTFDAHSITQVQEFWQAPNMATEPGLKAVELFDACLAGKIKVLWIMGTNPLASLPDANKIKAALAMVDTVIVSDVVTENDTLAYADIKLPALAWGEKDGTVTNSERTISRQRAFLLPPGQAKADWAAVAAVAKKMNFVEPFNWHHAHEVFREHAQLSCINSDSPLQFSLADVSHLSFREYQDWQPKQWPLDSNKPATRMFANGQFATKSGKANMVAVKPKSIPVKAMNHFTLNTGRLRDQWHTMARTGLAKTLTKHTQQFEVHIHPLDAQHANISNGQLVKISATEGEFFALARLETAQQRGDLFAPMHWNAFFANQGGVANSIASVVDPISGQPANKHAEVSITAADVRFNGFYFSDDEQNLPDWLNDTVNFKTYTQQGVLFQFFQCRKTWSEFVLSQPMPNASIHNTSSNNGYWAQGDKTGLQQWLIADTKTCNWPDIDFLDYAAVTDIDRLTQESLASGHTDDMANLGNIVCTCFSVTDRQISQYFENQPDGTLESLQKSLKCGTNCGSCLSEVKDFVNQHQADCDYEDAMAV